MGDKSLCSWCSSPSSSSSTLKVFTLIVPLIVISGLVTLLGTKTSNRILNSNYYPWAWSSVIPPPPPSSSSSSAITTVGGPNITTVEEISAARQDWRSRMVVGNLGEEVLSDDSIHSRSSSPPLAIEPINEVPPPVEKDEESSNTTTSHEPHIIVPVVKKDEESLNTTTSHEPRIIVPSMNESQVVPRIEVFGRQHSNLKKLEASLGQARAAIREAANNGNQTHDTDFVPVGPVYRNANAFHRSYLEMEKQFKIFVYEEGEPPVFHNGPCKSIYAMEGNFIYHMELSHFRTGDPEKAHVFFLPLSVTAIVHYVYDRDSHNWAPMRQTVRDYANLIAWKYRYWNRSVGADHFMLACHDWGPELSKSVPYLYKNSIRALCNANTSEGFDPAKDVSFPEILLPDGTTNRLLGGPSPSQRSILAFFAGGVHGPIRPILLEHWENKDEDVQVHKYLPKGVSYYGMLRKSKYCICPSGYEVASPRMVEALYTGCVPVLIKDHYVAPFSDVLNWKSFSVEIEVRDIPNLKAILAGISQRQYIRLQRRGVQVRRHFEVNSPPKRFDVFHMILHSIWLRRLNVRVRDF